MDTDKAGSTGRMWVFTDPLVVLTCPKNTRIVILFHGVEL